MSTTSATLMSRPFRNRIFWILAAIVGAAILVCVLPPASSHPAPAQQPALAVGL
jgi:hypothetical protein